MSQTLSSLQLQSTRLQNALADADAAHKAELAEREAFMHEVRRTFDACESGLLQKLHQAREGVAFERESRRAVEDVVRRVEEERERWKRSAVLYKKKVGFLV